MIKTTIDIKDSGGKEWAELVKKLSRGKSAYVTVGIHDDGRRYSEGSNPPTVSEVAIWNEFGTKTVPERSFLRSAVTESEQQRNNWFAEMTNNLIQNNWTVAKALEAIGFRMREVIRNKIKSNVPPPYGTGKHGNPPDVVKKAQDAKERKWPGMGEKTLQASRTLLDSVGFKVHM